MKRFWAWLNRTREPLCPCQHRERRCDTRDCPCLCRACAAERLEMYGRKVDRARSR